MNYTTVERLGHRRAPTTRPKSGTLDLPPGETAENITVPIIDRTGFGADPELHGGVVQPVERHHRHQRPATVTIGASGGHGGTIARHLRPARRGGGRGRRLHRPAGHPQCPGDQQVSVNYTTANGSGGNDTGVLYTNSVYQGQSGTLTFTPGVTTEVVRVPLSTAATSVSTGSTPST